MCAIVGLADMRVMEKTLARITDQLELTNILTGETYRRAGGSGMNVNASQLALAAFVGRYNGWNASLCLWEKMRSC